MENQNINTINIVGEVWKTCSGFSRYMVSNLGNVKSLPIKRRNHTGGEWIQPGKILNQRKNSDGYLQVCIYNDEGIRKTVGIHRLVAIAFCENRSKENNEVNHIDFDRTNNNAANLEWCSHSDNVRYSHNSGRHLKKPIKCLETNKQYESSVEASKTEGGAATNIRKSAKNNGKYSVYGKHYVFI